jgi:hypothetical protein
MGLLVIAAGIAACGSTELPRRDAGSGGDAPPAPADAHDDAHEGVTCPVGLSPGQTDQSDCPSDPASFSCPRTSVCTYPNAYPNQFGKLQAAHYCIESQSVVVPTSCAGDCPGVRAATTAHVVPLDATDCLTRPAMDCTMPRGRSEQDLVQQWLDDIMSSGCGGFPEETVAVSFENGCATEIRLSDDRPAGQDIVVNCLAGKVNAVRWACHDLACASETSSTLP